MRKHWLIGGSAGAVTLSAALVLLGAQDAQTTAQADDPASYPSGQPIAFPHNQHSGNEPGQNNMDCMYCHFSAERSVDAGIPPVALCMGCHQVVNGQNNPQEVDKVRGYWERQEPIPWVRIYKISDHAHFPHMRHIAAGLECQECHGEVQTMEVLNSRDPAWGGNNMGWCIDCHRQPDPETGQPQASVDCAVCHY